MSRPLSILIFTIISLSVTSAQLDNHGIYKIINRADGGVLTISSADLDDPAVSLKTWKDAAGQKWKAKQPVLAKSWEFKPTSNQGAALTADPSSFKIYGRDSSMGNTKYWKISPMGEGQFQIKNYDIKTCLGSQGLDSPVKLMPCDNSKATQWQFLEL